MVYLVNINLTSFVVLVNWHAHYVVNIELICSTFCTLVTIVPACVLVFDCFRAFAFHACLLLLPAFWRMKVMTRVMTLRTDRRSGESRCRAVGSGVRRASASVRSCTSAPSAQGRRWPRTAARPCCWSAASGSADRGGWSEEVEYRYL